MDDRVQTDEQLAAEAAREASDGTAFVQLMDRFRDRVWRICYRLMGNLHDAQDAAQEVFVRLFTERGKFAGRSKYSTWVYGVALRTCLTLRRGRSRRQKRIVTTSDEDLLQKTGKDRRQAEPLSLELDELLEDLDEEDRALLILKYAEDYRYEELAEMFDLSVSACKMRISRTRQRLKMKYPEMIKSPHEV